MAAYFLSAFMACLRPSRYRLRPGHMGTGLRCWPDLALLPSKPRHLTYATSCRTKRLQSMTEQEREEERERRRERERER